MGHGRVDQEPEKAQEELDSVIGPDRPMTEADTSNLPYLKCVAKEALRLHPRSPLMLPHKANANVKIGGYAILPFLRRLLFM